MEGLEAPALQVQSALEPSRHMERCVSRPSCSVRGLPQQPHTFERRRRVMPERHPHAAVHALRASAFSAAVGAGHDAVRALVFRVAGVW